MLEKVILINESNQEMGVAEKVHAHKEGLLHRAFSIFLFDFSGRILLQRRALTKYHSGGLWSNTCCGHPRPGERTEEAAHRRLNEEMGIQCALQEAFGVLYRAGLEGGLIEHEFDHVFVGYFNGVPILNTTETDDWAWIEFDSLMRSVTQAPERYSFWLKLLLPRVIEWHNANQNEGTISADNKSCHPV